MRNLLLLFVVLLIFFLLFVLFSNNNKQAITKINFIHSECLLDENTCIATLQDNQEITFTLEPKDLPVMELISLTIDGFYEAQKKIKIWFEGKDMNMGTHYMLPVSKKTGSMNISYHFEGMIPVCTIDSDMVWLLNAEFIHASRLYQVQFQLKAHSKD